jgi:hypothetical protein
MMAARENIIPIKNPATAPISPTFELTNRHSNPHTSDVVMEKRRIRNATGKTGYAT